ncbi:CMP-N-acetylneuraminate-poly-alpha-2,8-sialyltransferase-like [Glandiceps talaboti]
MYTFSTRRFRSLLTLRQRKTTYLTILCISIVLLLKIFHPRSLFIDENEGDDSRQYKKEELEESRVTFCDDDDLNEHIKELRHLYQTLSEYPSQQHKTNGTQLRNQLQTHVISNQFIFLTQEIAHIGAKRQFPRRQNETFVIGKDLYNHLLQRNPLDDKRFNKCNVVGNSGILLNSGCGKQIDDADYIFRCNLQPLGQFSVDAGHRSNLSTLNPSVIWIRYNKLSNRKERHFFQNIVAEYSGLVAIPTGGASGLKWSLFVMDFLKKTPLTIETVLLDPQHILSVRQFWKNNVTGTISTGLYLTTMALMLCEEVHLYGFWPFTYNPRGQPIPFHYTDDLKESSINHRMPEEFSLLMKLHQQGELKLHIEQCASSP